MLLSLRSIFRPLHKYFNVLKSLKPCYYSKKLKFIFIRKHKFYSWTMYFSFLFFYIIYHIMIDCSLSIWSQKYLYILYTKNKIYHWNTYWRKSLSLTVVYMYSLPNGGYFVLKKKIEFFLCYVVKKI